jgi:2,4-didehydro-3-deoxy-L-rhamnonate hydrolase
MGGHGTSSTGVATNGCEWLEVDGHRYQDDSTCTMIFGVAYLVSYLSKFMNLHSGDIISTGTPPGVGLSRKPPIFLRPGNSMHVGVQGLGEQRQNFVSDRL